MKNATNSTKNKTKLTNLAVISKLKFAVIVFITDAVEVDSANLKVSLVNLKKREIVETIDIVLREKQIIVKTVDIVLREK